MSLEKCQNCLEWEVKKREIGKGPWSDEPSRIEFVHGGFPCVLHRGGGRAWCGYVGVGKDHPWYEKDYDDVAADVHGGLTYAEHCQGCICHVVKEGEEDNLWWLGFDCAHAGDLLPLDVLLRINGIEPYGTYRDVAYVEAETKNLAEQAKIAAETTP